MIKKRTRNGNRRAHVIDRSKRQRRLAAALTRVNRRHGGALKGLAE